MNIIFTGVRPMDRVIINTKTMDLAEESQYNVLSISIGKERSYIVSDTILGLLLNGYEEASSRH